MMNVAVKGKKKKESVKTAVTKHMLKNLQAFSVKSSVVADWTKCCVSKQLVNELKKKDAKTNKSNFA